MAPDRTTVYFRINSAVFLVSIIIMLIISTGAGGFVGDGVFYVYPKRASENVLSLKESDSIKEYLNYKDIYVSFEAVGSMNISFEGMSAYSKVVYTDAEYVYMNKLIFADGWFFTKHQETLDVIVLSEALAWKLFGNTKAAGMQVTIADKQFDIVGVISQEQINEDNYFVWLPLNRENDKDFAESMYIQSSRYNKIDSHKVILDALDVELEKAINYKVTDMSEFVANISKRPVIGLSLLGIYIIVVLSVRLVGLIKKASMQDNGMRSNAVKIAGYVAIILVAMYFIDLDIWVPGFYGSGLNRLFETITNMGRLPGFDYLPYNMVLLNNLNTYSNIFFAVCLIALINMIFLVGFGIRNIRRQFSREVL